VRTYQALYQKYVSLGNFIEKKADTVTALPVAG
jgi:hypothetical protein